MLFEGKEVVDAKRNLTFTVTDSDIAKSRKNSPATCAVATCLKRECHAPEARVFLSRMYVMNPAKTRWVRYITPPSARAELIAFDRGGKFEPGTFTAKFPKYESMQLGYSKPTGPKKTTGKPRIYHSIKSIRPHGPMGGNRAGATRSK